MRELIERLENADEGSLELDKAILMSFGFTWRGMNYWHHDNSTMWRGPTFFTRSLDAAVALVEQVLPGWTWRVASCHVSDDAWVIPDFNHPVHGERLMREYGQVEGDPAAYWQEITDVDLRPSGRPAIALCLALLRAKEQETRG